MGAFFTNVQVRGADADAVARAIREDAAQRGLDELEGAEGADRSVLILPPDEGGWIAIYDEATEGQDATALEALAAIASRAVHGFAFTVLIHDSDVLDLRLFRDGARVDRLDSYPGYFGGRAPSKKKRAEVAGDPSEWASLGDPEALRAAWSSEDLFAERTLGATCRAVGCDVRRASTGYRYATKDGDAIPEGTITLRFRARVRPSWEEESGDPPALVTESYVDREIPLAVGDELRVSLGARSAGQGSTGLGVRCWGSALERELVVVERFEVVVGNVLAGAKHVSVVPEISRSKGGELLLVADLPEKEIPAGSAEPFAGFRPGMDVMKAMEAMQRSKVHVNVIGRVVAAGKGEIGIGLVPLARIEGAAGTIARLAIDAPFARPLRARTDAAMGMTSHLLRPLSGDTLLTALVSVDAPRADVAAIARAMLDDARDVIGTGDEVQTAIHFAEPARRPKAGRGKVRTLLQGKRWDALVRQMETEQVVSVTVVARQRTPEEMAARGGAGELGISVGTSILRDREDERVPTIAAWIDATLAPAVRERWSARIDEAMRGRGVQASMAWSGAAIGIEHTAYESACGIAHGIGTLRRWITRWVRVPGNDRLWLSRGLASRVDRAALASIADVEELGDGVRIALRDRAAWQALERAIAELLPTAEESHRVVMEHHRPR